MASGTTPTGDIKSLTNLLSSAKLDQVFEDIRRKITSTNGDQEVVALVRALFAGSLPTDEQHTKRRFDILKFCVNLLQVADLSSETATELLSLLLVEVEPFPTSSLIKVAEHLVSEFQKSEKPEGKWLETIPRVLSILSVRDTIVYQGLDTSGVELKSLMVKSLCDCDDMSQAAIMMLTIILKDVTLSKEEVELVVNKLLCVLPNVNYQEMPTFMYQFLLFSSKGQRKKILQGIVAYFISEDDKRRAQDDDNDPQNRTETAETMASRQTEGTVVLLLKVNARQDRGLGKDLVAMIKSLQYNPMISLSPFVFSIALSLACVQRYQDEVLDILKGMILRAFKQKEKAHNSAWIRDILTIKQDIVSIVKEAIHNSKHGWDHVGQGLVKFGFLLLDSFGPKLVCGRVPNKCKPHALTISEQICDLGCMILRETFKAHSSVRSKIFEQILTRVIIKSTSPVSHYIDVLFQTVQSDPQLLLEILSKLIEVLDYLPFVPYENAVKILKALTPLLKISMPLKDTLMLILRKALFHHSLETRKIAITGYITILKRISAIGKLSLSQSQSTMSSQASSCSMSSQLLGDCSFNGTTKSESMCLEIMGILKRILMQQAEVKQVLYEGLYDAVVKNSSLSDIILELLLSQFEKFQVVADDADFPLNVFSCIKAEKEKIVLEEPFADLMSAICLILYEVRGDINGVDEDMELELEQSAQIMLESTLKTLIAKLIKSSPGGSELEQLEDLDDGLSDEKFKIYISLLINIYEALMEHLFLSNKTHAVEEYEKLLCLFEKYQTLLEKLENKKGSKSKKGKQNKQSNFQPPDTQLTIRFFGVVIETLFADGSSENEGINILRNNNEFVKFILQACHAKLVAYNDAGRSDGFSLHMERTSDYICTIAKAYLHVYAVGLSSSFSSLQTFELSSFFIKGLGIIFSYMFSSNERNHSKLVSELAKFIGAASDDGATKVLKKFQKLTIKALSDPENDEKLKEVVPLFSIITDLCTVSANLVSDDVYQWIKQLSIEQSFDDVPLVRKLVSLCLTLSHQQKDCAHLLKDIASDIHHHLGDIDSSVSVSSRTNYNVIASTTSSELIPLVVQHIEQILDEVDWVLNIMKADAQLVNTAIQDTLPSESDNFHEKEGNICTLLLDLMKVYNELEQTEISIGTVSNSILKVTTSIYKGLTMICKYYLSRYEQRTGYLHPLFAKVVKYSGTHLTPPVYGFITYIQTKEMENMNNKKKSKTDGAPKVVREVKTIPALVFAIELYERHLIMLSKKTKKDLMSHMKHSTARDFRIDPSALEAARTQHAEEESNDNSVADNTVQDDDASHNDVPASHNDVTASRNDVTASRNGVTASRNDATVSRNDVAASCNDVTASRNDVTASRNDVTASRNDVTASRKDVTASRNDVTASRNDVTESGNDGTSVRDAPLRKKRRKIERNKRDS